jgi:RimJ/RimL family protein N-acetyltransferase
MENRRMLIKGEHIGLAEMLESDQSFFRKWLAENEELRQQVDNPSVPSEDDQAAWFKRSQEADRRMFSVLRLEDNRLIGHCGFVDVDHEEKTAQLRITLGDTSSHGKGYGTEATQLLLRYAFDEMGLQSVWLRVLSDNTRAIRVYEKNGFISSDEHDEDPRIVRMRITRDDFHHYSA